MPSNRPLLRSSPVSGWLAARPCAPSACGDAAAARCALEHPPNSANILPAFANRPLATTGRIFLINVRDPRSSSSGALQRSNAAHLEPQDAAHVRPTGKRAGEHFLGSGWDQPPILQVGAAARSRSPSAPPCYPQPHRQAPRADLRSISLLQASSVSWGQMARARCALLSRQRDSRADVLVSGLDLPNRRFVNSLRS